MADPLRERKRPGLSGLRLTDADSPGPVPAEDDGAAAPARPAGRRPPVVAAVVAIVIAVAEGLVGRQVVGAEPTGRTTHDTVSLQHMSYSQPTVQVLAGNRSAITLRSDDEDMGGSGNPSSVGVT